MDKLDIKRMDHHGLVMGVIKDIELIETLNSCLGTRSNEKLSVGERIAAMVLNGLGFTDQPMYMIPDFLDELPLESFFGAGVRAKDFDRFAMARALDRIHHQGEDLVFAEVATVACNKVGISRQTVSFDMTSFSVTGECDSTDEACLSVTHGYSKDHRPDLKQIVTELVVSHDNGIPLLMKNWDGNAADTVIFEERSKQLVESFQSGYVNHVTAGG